MGPKDNRGTVGAYSQGIGAKSQDVIAARPQRSPSTSAGHPMRKTLTCLVLVAALTEGARAEHVTREEIAIYKLQSQNSQEFADQFKQFTDSILLWLCWRHLMHS
jgi:hypothetical protein